MIDFQDMVNRQQGGEKEITSLREDEKTVLQHYCSLAAEALLKTGAQRDATIEEVVINAFRNGVGLGLGLRIVNGEVQGR